MPVRLKPAAPWSRVKYSTTEPLRSHSMIKIANPAYGFDQLNILMHLQMQPNV